MTNLKSQKMAVFGQKFEGRHSLCYCFDKFKRIYCSNDVVFIDMNQVGMKA